MDGASVYPNREMLAFPLVGWSPSTGDQDFLHLIVVLPLGGTGV